MSFDLSAISDSKRKAAAEVIRKARDIKLPNLEFLNSSPCESHTETTMGCSNCGVLLKKHQRVAAAWLYLVKHGLLGDIVGAGKTISVAGLIAVLKQYNELKSSKVLIICRPAAIHQWAAEINRSLPRLKVITAVGVKQKRVDKYVDTWDIMITGYQMLLKDIEDLLEFDYGLVVVDDVDTLRRKTNTSAYTIKRLARESGRVVISNATPLHKRLLELYSVLEPIGGRDAFGTEKQFKFNYIRDTKPETYTNMSDLKTRLTPLVLRRTTDQLDDVEMPDLAPPNNVYLDLYPAQREKYIELQRGVLRIIKEESDTVKKVEAMAKWTYGAQVCSGLATLGELDLPRTSVKLDWLENTLTGDLSDEKVVVFAQFKNCVRALAARLDRNDIGYEIIWGENNKSSARAASLSRFWTDKDCKILIGTTAITSSLNLQVARHLVCVDQIMNQALMVQLSGRIRRVGSTHKTVYVHNLLTTQTQEENYIDLLSKEQALFNYTFNDSIDLYPQLSAVELLQLIGRPA